MGSYSTTGLLEESTEGAAPPDSTSLILHVGTAVPRKPQRSFQASFWLYMLKCLCVCLDGERCLDVAMEEVCCRLARRRRRTSSLTLTLPRCKLVRPENWAFF